jgi:hypothetical protein
MNDLVSLCSRYGAEPLFGRGIGQNFCFIARKHKNSRSASGFHLCVVAIPESSRQQVSIGSEATSGTELPRRRVSTKPEQ